MFINANFKIFKAICKLFIFVALTNRFRFKIKLFFLKNSLKSFCKEKQSVYLKKKLSSGLLELMIECLN